MEFAPMNFNKPMMPYHSTATSSSSDHHHHQHDQTASSSSSASSLTAAAAFAVLMESSSNNNNNNDNKNSAATPDSIVSSSSSASIASSRRVSSSSSVLSTSSSNNRKQRGGSGGVVQQHQHQHQQLLPLDFIPTPYTVVCGRGKRCSDNVGNRRLQVIASMFVGRYGLANRKEEKSEIVTEILDMVKEAACVPTTMINLEKGCPNMNTNANAAFVRYCTNINRWIVADNLCAREKIGTVLRDCLHSKYKSSTKSKLQRRKARKEVIKKAQLMKNLDKVRNPTIQFQLLPIPIPIPSPPTKLRREISTTSSSSSVTTSSSSL